MSLIHVQRIPYNTSLISNLLTYRLTGLHVPAYRYRRYRYRQPAASSQHCLKFEVWSLNFMQICYDYDYDYDYYYDRYSYHEFWAGRWALGP